MKRVFLAAVGITLICATNVFAIDNDIEKSQTVVYVNGKRFYIHTIKKGDTLYSLAKEYGVPMQEIVANNPTVVDNMKIDQTLKIPFTATANTDKQSSGTDKQTTTEVATQSAKADTAPSTPTSATTDITKLDNKTLKKTFSKHNIKAGDTLYSISRTYDISIETLIADNGGLDPSSLRVGDTLYIRKNEIGKTDDTKASAELEQHVAELNNDNQDADYTYHVVKLGETLYSLSRQYGRSEQEINDLNNLSYALKAGSIVKIPKVKQQDAVTVEESTPTIVDEPKVKLKALSMGETLNIALMLPLSTNGAANANYLEFYQGFLMGLNDVKAKYERQINVSLFNTAHDIEKVKQIVEMPEFERANLIVGPVYEDVLSPVIDYAEKNSIPVVSPLASMDNTRSSVLFQMSPAPERKYAKVADLVSPEKNVVLIYTSKTDKDFEREMKALLDNRHYTTYQYGASVENNAVELANILKQEGDNTFIVMADNEIDVDRILATIASAYANLSARGNTLSQFNVLGNSRWNRYNNIDRTAFFNNRVVMVSTYHAKRDADIIKDFDSQYVQDFNALPSLYSYRGYDAAKIFATAMYSDIQFNMEDNQFTPLQTTYLFKQNGKRATHINDNWVRVNYNNDFTITIE